MARKTRQSGRKRPTSTSKVGRTMRVRTERMRKLNQVTFCLFVAFCCAGVIAATIPHFKELRKMESELVDVQRMEKVAIAKKDHKERVDRALEQDPEYLKIIARDRLDLMEEGETIFRFPRD